MKIASPMLPLLLLLPFFSTGRLAAEDPARLRPPASEAAPLAQPSLPLGPPDPAAALEFFEKRVRPLLAATCHSCHSAETKPSGGLRVDDHRGLLTGGDGGPAIVPGDPEHSLLLIRIRSMDPKKRMPRDSDPLTPEQISDLEQWIRDGAVWPKPAVPVSLGRENPEYAELKARHWAWQPLTDPPVPETGRQDWARSTVDRFVLAGLERAGLAPVPDAEPAVLLRRLSFDLTGLPPSPEQQAAFLRDPSPAALETLVDRLLDSPAYAEKWGRHWLDIARYGESTGPSRNIPYPFAWRYRDYVLDAVRRDVPLDRFIREQIAGDLLPADSAAERDRLITATGFLALGVKDVNQRFKTRFIMDNTDEQIDTVTRSVLALTVSCARCHDHKTDPVPATDYYALAGIFTSTDDCAGVRSKMGGGGLDYYNPAMLARLTTELPPPPEAEVEELRGRTEEAKKAWDAIRGTPEGLKRAPNGQPVQRPFRLKYEKLQAELNALTNPDGRRPAVHGVREAAAPADTELRLRGEVEKPGPVVPRGFLTAFPVPGTQPVNPAGSGRLELAHWLTSRGNPLTPRVAANRVWQRLFGAGLVSTVDNFGVTGALPSHPELLDHLAQRLLADGWSVRKLVRGLVLTRTYQLGSSADPSALAQDPANRLLWRQAPRRLGAEDIRDAVLASSGTLRSGPPPSAAVAALAMAEIRDNGPEAAGIRKWEAASPFRSVYLPLLRGITPASLEPFDPVIQTMVTGQRDTTNVPAQALFLLNSAFIRRQSLVLAERLAAEPPAEDARLLTETYHRVLGRAPQPQEITRDLAFLAESTGAWKADQPAGNVLTRAAESAPPEAPPAVAGAAAAVPENPDDVPRDDRPAAEEVIQPGSPRAAAWQALIQALFSSAEFRILR